MLSVKEAFHMCELYGFIGIEDTILNDSLKIFYSHGVKHPHGWGLAHWDNNYNIPAISKDASPSTESFNLNNLLVNPILTKVALGHIRFATIGSIKNVNCHPFLKSDSTGRNWTLVHNGNIYSGLQLIPYFEKQTGETDSERILLYLIDCIDKKTFEKGKPLTNLERCQVVETFIKDLAPRNRLNLLIYDSEQLYVHANMKDTLYFSHKKNSYYFSTTPLENNFIWDSLPINKLYVYSHSELIYSGLNHGFEFIKSKPSNFDNFNI
jgi:glutamine amidotransferase